MDVIVLDRPNPIGGLVQGNVLQPGFVTTVGQLEIPMRHGMTLGELARLARSDLGLTVNLGVVPAGGWRRSIQFDRTGLPFIPPSPNLRTLESLYHYPGTCLFEGTNLSVGRGSDAPFQQIGAPWLDTTAVLTRIRGAKLQGGGVPGRIVHADQAGRRKVRRHPGAGNPAQGNRPGDLRSRRRRRSTSCRQSRPCTGSGSAGFRPISTAWRAPHRFGRRSSAGTAPAEIVRGWREERERFLQRSRGARIYQD